MAGDIQEHFSISFQADSFHSGSISFGRFENESLSWERRSSFSHNRYLEEVEKFSKPGSVIEKKAYFEAHFKKKGGFLRQSSSDSHRGTEYENSEYDTSETAGNTENSEHVNEGSQHAHFDESPECSDCARDYEGTECQREDQEGSISDPQVGGSFLNTADTDVSVYGDRISVHTEDTNQSEMTHGQVLSVPNDETQRITKQSLSERVGNDIESSGTILSSSKTEPTCKADKTSLKSQPTPSSKLISRRNTKFSMPQVKSRINPGQAKRSPPGDARKSPISVNVSKSSAKFPSGRERESLQGTNTGKHPLTSISSIRTFHRTLQVEDSKSQKSKAVLANKSGAAKESRGNSRESHQSSLTPESTRSRPHQKTSRPGPATSTSHTVHRAEKSKQVKEDDEAVKFQKSLNFKAKPIPSKVAVSSGSDGKKPVSSSTIATKARRMSLTPSSEALDPSRKTSPKTEPVKARASNNKDHSPLLGSKSDFIGKKEGMKEKESNVQKLHKPLASCRVTKGQRVIEGRRVEPRQAAI